MKSRTLQNSYKKWTNSAPIEQVELVDAIFKECEDHYDAGGDTVVECMSPEEILLEFRSVEEAKEYCGIQVEAALNARWGEDGDPELSRHDRFNEW